MIRKIVSFAIHQPLFLSLLLLLFIGAGVAAFRSLPIEAFPDVTDVQVSVITLFPGHAPEEVEKQVTIPLEIELSGLPHSVRLFSHTQFGLSFIYITFDDAVNDYFARQQVLERLQNADLPDGVKPALGAARQPRRRDLPLLPQERHADADRTARHRGLGGRAAVQDRARRRGRGQPRRLHQAIPGRAQPDAAASPTASRCRRSSRPCSAATPMPAAATSSRARSST